MSLELGESDPWCEVGILASVTPSARRAFPMIRSDKITLINRHGNEVYAYEGLM